jgi:hypothetical protein
MFSYDKYFDEIYQSLPPGLVIAACGPKSLVALRSFCFSLKGAAIRSGSDAMLYRDLPIPIDWNAVGAQMESACTRGVRLFIVNRFEDNSAAGIIARLKSEPLFDGLDGSINPERADVLREGFQRSRLSLIVTTVAVKESQIRDRRIARMMGNEQGVFIAVEHDRFTDDFYSIWVTTGATEKNYAADFVSECPETLKVQPRPQLVVMPTQPVAGSLAKPRSSWLRRLLG